MSLHGCVGNCRKSASCACSVTGVAIVAMEVVCTAFDAEAWPYSCGCSACSEGVGLLFVVSVGLCVVLGCSGVSDDEVVRCVVFD